MILRRLSIRDFRSLTDLTVELRPGLNLIVGPNEAGKSTLQAAIVALLFADPARRNATIESWRPWGRDAWPVLSADFVTPAVQAASETSGRGFQPRPGGEVGSSGQLLEYTLTRDFGARTASLLLPDASRLTDRGKIEAALTALLGTADERIYLATACLRQQQWARVTAGEQLQEALQQALSGGAEDTAAQAILRKLEDNIKSLEKGLARVAPVNAGPLARLRDEIAEVESTLAAARPEAARLDEARARRERDGRRLEELSAELSQTRALADSAAEARELDTRLGELRHRADDLSSRLRQVETLDAQIAELEAGFAEGPQPDEPARRDAENLTQRRATAEEAVTRALEEASRLQAEVQDLEARAAAPAESDLPAGSLERATSLEGQASAAAEQARLLENEAAALAARLADTRRRQRPRPVLLVAGAAALIAGLALSLSLPAARIPGVALALIGSGLLATALLRRLAPESADLPDRLAAARQGADQARREAEARRQELTTLLVAAGCETVADLARELESRASRRGDLEATLRERRRALDEQRERVTQNQDLVRHVAAKLTELTSAFNLDSVEALTETVEARAVARRELASRRDRRAGLLAGQEPAALQSQFSELAVEITGLGQRLATPELALARMSPEQYHALAAKLAALGAEDESLRRDLHQADLDVAAIGVDSDQVRALEGRLAALQDRRRLYQDQLDVRKLAFAAIGRARDQVVADVTRTVGPRLDALMSLLTEGRYPHLALGPDMSPSVTAPGLAEPLDIPAEADPGLSCATREQVFLAVRLAIIEMLWPQGGPPLLLDDPLVNFDPSRRAAALAALRDAAADRQILLFTCSHDYDGHADHTVNLPRTTHSH